MKLLLICTFLLLTIKINAQEFEDTLINKLNTQIEQYVEGISPGMAVGIVKDGKIVYEKYIGYSNLEHKILINEETRFNIASNAKQYTALCIIKLVEQGRLKMSDDIRSYLPNLYKNTDYEITISNLLTHTSGIRDIYDLWALKGQTWWKLFIDNGDAIELLESQRDLNFSPGTEYLYSNSNYILLSELIATINEQSFSEVAQSLFTELGMHNTNFLSNYMTVIPNKARPYGNWNGWREYPSITETHGDGALFTTMIDQLKWEKIIQLNNGAHLTKEIISESQSRISLDITENYGYGLKFGKYKDLSYTYHDGNTGAYNASFIRMADKALSIVIMSNNGSVPTNYLAQQILDIIYDLKDNKTIVYPALPDKIEKLREVKSILGNYEDNDGSVISITEKEGVFYREIYQREPLKLIKEKDGLFHYENNKDLKMNFTNINKSDQKLTIYLSSQKPNTFNLRPKLNLDKIEINGTFFNDETNTEMVIEHITGNSYAITKNGRERKAKLVLNDYLRMMNSYEIKVIRDQNNKVTGLNVKNGRIKNVIFNKIR